MVEGDHFDIITFLPSINLIDLSLLYIYMSTLPLPSNVYDILRRLTNSPQFNLFCVVKLFEEHGGHFMTRFFRSGHPSAHEDGGDGFG